MSMSTHVIGFRPPDAKWKAMMAVWVSCQHAGVSAPKEVNDFFDDCPPDENGVEIDLEETSCVKEYNVEGAHGFEVDVRKLPKDIHIIRFANRY